MTTVEMNSHALQLIDICSVISKGDSKPFMKRRFKGRNVEPLPHVYAAHHSYADFLLELSSSLNSVLKPSASDEYGIMDSDAIDSDFSSIRTQPGSTRIIPFKEKQPLVNIKGYRGLNFVLEAAEWIGNYIRANYNSEAMQKIPVLTSVGMPFCHSDNAIMPHWLSIVGENVEKVSDMLLSQDLSPALERYGIMLCSNTNVRLQCDKWVDGKVKHRTANYFGKVFADNYDQKGDRFFVDAEKGYMLPNGLASCRTRQVNGGNKCITMAISSVIEGGRSVYEKRFSKTFKSLDKINLKQNVSNYPYVIGLDVESYDTTLPRELAFIAINMLPLNSIGKSLLYRIMHQPVYCSDVNGLGDPMVSDNPLRRSSDLWFGLQSGGPSTSFHSKGVVPLVIYASLKEHGLIKGSFEEFMDHKLECAIVNQGDDTLLLSTIKIDESVINDLGLDFLKISVEKYAKFAGLLIYRNNEGVLNVTHSLTSMFEKIFCPERSWDSQFHKFRMYGIKECMKSDIYGAHPKFIEAKSVMKDVFKKHMHMDFDELVDANLVIPDTSIETRNVLGIELALDVSKILWKFDISELEGVDLSEYIVIMDKATQDKFKNCWLDLSLLTKDDLLNFDYTGRIN